MITIHNLNETYIKIDCEQHISRELADYFTITIPNSQYHRFGNFKHWNGKLKLFKIRERTLYRGLIPYVEQFARDKGYTVTFTDDSLNHMNNISLFEVESYCKSLKLPMVPYKHQLDSITHCLRNKRITLVSPTGSGKSLVLYVIIRSLLPILLKTKQKIVLIVPTTNLVEQMYTDFQDYSTNNKWSVEKYCHRIYQGHEKTTNKPIIISTWQSLEVIRETHQSYFKGFLGVLGDECHLCSAKTLQGLIGLCTSASYRVGLTGTLQETKSHRLSIEGLFGPVYTPTTTSQLIDEKKLADFQIKCIVLKHPNRTLLPDYRDELEYLISCESRNRFIRNLAMSLDTNTLILYDYVEKHGRIIEEAIKLVNKEGKKKVYLIYGGTPVEEVQRIRTEMEHRNDIILLASYRKFQLGANVKNLHNIIFASPSKSRIRVCQSIGRELRMHPSKNTAYLFDISDHFLYTNTTLLHFGERIKMYNSERFPYKMYKVTLQ